MLTYVYVSALLDDDSCETCAGFDGRKYPSVEAAAEQFPDAGSNAGCTSLSGCRCTLVTVYDEES